MKKFALTILTCLLHFNLLCMEIDSNEEKAQNQILGYKYEWEKILKNLHTGATYTSKDAKEHCVALPENAIQQIFEYSFPMISIDEILSQKVSMPCMQLLDNHKTDKEFDNICYIEFSPDKEQLETQSNFTRTLWNWNKDTLLTYQSSSDEFNAHYPCRQISPNYKLYATGTNDNFIHVSVPTKHKLINKIPHHNGALFSLTFSPDGNFLIHETQDRNLKVLNVQHMYKLLELLENKDRLKPIERIKFTILSQYLQNIQNKKIMFKDVDTGNIDPILIEEI